MKEGALPGKAGAESLLDRFREIVSDPVNLLIRRCPMAGTVADGMVCLHNGIWVPLEGEGSYFGEFSRILVLNRGVHEPLEEYVFQELLELLPERPTCLELGAYWAHYSMWLKLRRPTANAVLVEPAGAHLMAGLENFRRNGFAGEFIQEFVGPGQFEVDRFLEDRPGLRLEILHADIDLHEVEMLKGARRSLERRAIDYALISTHSEELHQATLAELAGHGYRIEVSSDFDTETTSFDGFVLASSPGAPRVFTTTLRPLGRLAIARSAPETLLESLAEIRRASQRA